MTYIDLYQSVLRKLSLLPTNYLEEVDKYLSDLTNKTVPPKQQVSDIMSFSGSWSDMSTEEFEGLVEELQNIRKDMFQRNIKL